MVNVDSVHTVLETLNSLTVNNHIQFHTLQNTHHTLKVSSRGVGVKKKKG